MRHKGAEASGFKPETILFSGDIIRSQGPIGLEDLDDYMGTLRKLKEGGHGYRFDLLCAPHDVAEEVEDPAPILAPGLKTLDACIAYRRHRLVQLEALAEARCSASATGLVSRHELFDALSGPCSFTGTSKAAAEKNLLLEIQHLMDLGKLKFRGGNNEMVKFIKAKTKTKKARSKPGLDQTSSL